MSKKRKNNRSNDDLLSSLSSQIGKQGPFWIMNKKVGLSIGFDTQAVLMELVYAYEKYVRNKQDRQTFYKVKDELLALLPMGKTKLVECQNKLTELHLITVTHSTGLDRKNQFDVNIDNVLEFHKDPAVYIEAIESFRASQRVQELSGTNSVSENVENSQRPENGHATTGKRSLINKDTPAHPPSARDSLENTPSFLRKREIHPLDSCSLRSQVGSSSLREEEITSNISFIAKRRIFDIVPNSVIAENTNKSSVAPHRGDILRDKLLKTQEQLAVPKNNRKVHKNTIEALLYWNEMAGLSKHKLVEKDGEYPLHLQSSRIQEVNEHIIKLLRGELYTHCKDIIHQAVKTKKFTMSDIKKAILRISQSTSIGFNGSKVKPSLSTFFFNNNALVYPDNNKGRYKYRYPFIHYINGEVEEAPKYVKPAAIKNEGIVRCTLNRFREEGVEISELQRNTVSKAIDKAYATLEASKRNWQVDEVSMITEFPGLFFRCFYENNVNGISDIWLVANFKIEPYAKMKGYMR